MQLIKDLFNIDRILIAKSKKTMRGELIVAFTERLNRERNLAYKPLTLNRIAYMLSVKYPDGRMVFPTSELDYFYKKCCEANNFSKCFWWHFKKD